MPLRFAQKVRRFIFGQPRNLADSGTFHKITLIAILAWIGLGADGLSSSCYGPEEAFRALGSHIYLSLFLAIATALTVFIISSSYTHIVEHFPTGGGGYIVATKLISPTVGMISGAALLVDYVLTVSVSISSGCDAIFSFLPVAWHPYRFYAIVFALGLLTLMNLRGVRESVLPLVPVFGLFVITHLFAIGYSIISQVGNLGHIAGSAVTDYHAAIGDLGLFGVLFLLMKAYSMGAGTYTGIEAVSNSLPILREPKVDTARKTMRYMAISLAVVAGGLILSYLIFSLKFAPGKTMNAVLFENLTASWNPGVAKVFIFGTLAIEAATLIIAAQTGFLDGPRVISNMALDHWMPTRFAHLSERLVTQNGVLVMGIAAFFVLLFSGGSVRLLVVLYSINVFLTFTLSQFAIMKFFLTQGKQEKHRWRKLTITTLGFLLTAFILIMVVVIKFNEGGWATLLVTGAVVAFAIFVKRHYVKTAEMLKRLDDLLVAVEEEDDSFLPHADRKACEDSGLVAVLLVNGFTGLGLHSLLAIFRLFGTHFKKFIFLEVGVMDAGRFKGRDEVANLETHVKGELGKYVDLMTRMDYDAEAVYSIGTDVPEEVENLAEELKEKYNRVVFFVGQLMFEEETPLTRFLHSYTAFAVQKRLYRQGIALVTLPIRVYR